MPPAPAPFPTDSARPTAQSTPVLRFAPSPNGFLHLGHAYSALMNHRLARRLGGRLLLRFEDIDRSRCRPDYEDAAIADLTWLGIRWETPVCRQSSRFPLYGAALQKLDAAGLLYPCFCSRRDIVAVIGSRPDWPRDPDGSPLYPGTCRQRSAAERLDLTARGTPAALRLDMTRALARCPPDLGWTEWREGDRPVPIAADPARWGDALLSRKDIPTSYHISVVVDDAAQGVTDIVRGQDLSPATDLHRLLQTLLDLPAPVYHHHRLILDPNGEKLSKSRNSPTLHAMRRAGISIAEMAQDLGYVGGVQD